MKTVYAKPDSTLRQGKREKCPAASSQFPIGGRQKCTTSQRIARRVMATDAAATFAVLGLCALSILRNFSGSLPYLTALIGALQVVTGVVLTAYFSKSKAENCRGGIVYDAALRPDEENV